MKKTPGLIITYPFAMGNFNGGSRMTREIARHIGRMGIPVYLIVVSLKFQSSFPRQAADKTLLGYEFDAQLAADNVTVIRVTPHIIDRYLDGLLVRRAVKQLLAEKPISAVLSYHSEGVFLPRFLRQQDIPFGIIATWQSYERTMQLPSKRRKPLKYLTAFLQRQSVINSYRQADRLFASSDHSGRELVDFVGVRPERITTCYLGVSPAFAQLHRPEPTAVNRFLFFGRIIKSKGVADAILAFKQLAVMGCQDWRFDIYGQGQHDWARSLIAAQGLEKQIFVHDPLKEADLHQALIDAHTAVLPSHIEAFGLAFAEAQAAGLPVIAYAAGSVPEVVAHNQTGWLAPTHNIDQLTAYLLQAIQNPQTTYQMGLAGRERAKELFTWPKSAATIIKGITNS